MEWGGEWRKEERAKGRKDEEGGRGGEGRNEGRVDGGKDEEGG